jgi:hypothetical protein
MKWLPLALIVVVAAVAYVRTPAEHRRAWWNDLRSTVRESVSPRTAAEHDANLPATLGGREEAEADEAAQASTGGEHDPETTTPSRLQKVEGLSAIRLTAEEQRQTGVALQTMESTVHLSESLAAGRVLDIQPLVDLRASYSAARGEQEIHRAAIAASGRSVERLRTLNREGGNVSTRQLQEAESQAASDRARLAAAERRMQDIRSQALLTWGEALVEMSLAEDSQLFEQLVTHQDVLVLVTLRRGEELPEGLNFIYVGPSGDRTRARKAYLVSAATQTDPVSQGETYFYRTNASKLRVGMRMDAWIPRPGQPREGVETPGTAVIWYANKLWVYVKSGEELFVRRPLQEYEETRDGWFVTKGLTPGDQIVVGGAQMLFSEEFRSNIPSEDEARE